SYGAVSQRIVGPPPNTRVGITVNAALSGHAQPAARRYRGKLAGEACPTHSPAPRVQSVEVGSLYDRVDDVADAGGGLVRGGLAGVQPGDDGICGEGG